MLRKRPYQQQFLHPFSRPKSDDLNAHSVLSAYCGFLKPLQPSGTHHGRRRYLHLPRSGEAARDVRREAEARNMSLSALTRALLAAWVVSPEKRPPAPLPCWKPPLAAPEAGTPARDRRSPAVRRSIAGGPFDAPRAGVVVHLLQGEVHG